MGGMFNNCLFLFFFSFCISLARSQRETSSIFIVVVLLSAHLCLGSGLFSGFYGVGSVSFYEKFAVLVKCRWNGIICGLIH